MNPPYLNMSTWFYIVVSSLCDFWQTDSDVVFSCLQGMYGISDAVYLSLPCVLNGGGVASVVNMTLTDDEVSQLQESASTLWDIQKDLQDV